MSENSPIDKLRECCLGGPLRVDTCADCPKHPIQEFRAWLDTYGHKTTFDRGDMAACWYASKRAVQSATTENMDERDFRALEHLLAGRITCSDDLPENERPRSLNARLLFGQIFRLRTAAQAVVSTRTEDFSGPEAERHERALDALRNVCQYVISSSKDGE